MTNNLQKYLDYIFHSFAGFKIGQGGFFTRTWNNDRKTDREFKTHVFDVANVLFQNGVLCFDGDNHTLPFVKLGQNGFDFMQGGNLQLSNLSISELIDISQSKENIYNRLWDFVGNEQTAPFYLKGSDYYNTIAPYVGLSSYTYSQYTRNRISEGKSASRISWYRETFYALNPNDIESFLNDLSNKIVSIYQPQYSAVEEDSAVDEIEWADIVTPTSQSNRVSGPTVPAASEVKRVIFITYTWETSVTPGHKEWVKSLAEALIKNGFDVRLDQFQPFGTEMNVFMAESVREADRILLICTPTFKSRQDNVDNAAGFEASLISNNLLKNIKSTKFVPIIRIGDPAECMPDYLGNRNGLIWRIEDDSKQKFEELLSDLKRN